MTKRGILLVLVMVSLALAAALIAPLALLTGTHALAATQRDDALIHRLAGDSLVAVLPEWLATSSPIRKQLDQENRALLHIQVGTVQVDAILQDDTAKLPLPALFDRRRPERLQSALQRLAGLIAPQLTMARTIPNAGSLDELFESSDEKTLFGDLETVGVADFVTTLGNRGFLNRATEEVLEALFQDLKPGLGGELSRLRRLHAKDTPAELLVRVEIPESVRREALPRLAEKTERYSLRIRTSSPGDIRWRYVICSATEPALILLDWEIAP